VNHDFIEFSVFQEKESFGKFSSDNSTSFRFFCILNIGFLLLFTERTKKSKHRQKKTTFVEYLVFDKKQYSMDLDGDKEKTKPE